MSGLRITAGELRGRHIPLPRHELRPTSGKARQAFFNMVSASIADANFLDLFSGSGVFSFEAVSRGASAAWAIDQSPKAIRQINELAREWNIPVIGIAADAMRGMKRLPKDVSFRVVFADPPYDYPHYDELLLAIDREIPLAEDAVVGLEHRSGDFSSMELTLNRLVARRTARYGTVSIAIFDHHSL